MARNGGSAGGGCKGGGGSDGGGEGGGGDGGGGDGAGITTNAAVGWLGVVVTGTPMKTPVDAVDVIAFDMLAAAAWAAAKESVVMMAVMRTEPAVTDREMREALTPVVAARAAT